MLKPRYVETKDLSWETIDTFMEMVRSDFYSDHNDLTELIKNMGKAIAYAETAWSLDRLTRWKAQQLVQKAESIIKEVNGGYNAVYR